MPYNQQRRIEVRKLLEGHKKVFDEFNHWALRRYQETHASILEPWLLLNKEAQELGAKIEAEIENPSELKDI